MSRKTLTRVVSVTPTKGAVTGRQKPGQRRNPLQWGGLVSECGISIVLARRRH